MKIKNYFFKKIPSFFLSDITKVINSKPIKRKIKIVNISDLSSAKKNDISFFNSFKYSDLLKKTKAKYIITNIKYSKFVSKFCYPIIVNNVLNAVASITNLFYPFE